MKEVPLAELVMDFDLYIRDSIDTRIVRQYCKSSLAGAEFPPILIEKKSRRIVDGFKRARMYKLLGIEMVSVVEKSYKSDAELLADAIRFNAAHGQPLDDADRVRCIILAGKLGLSDKALAGALGRSIEGIDELRTNKTAHAGALTVPLKGTIKHMAGKKLSKGQAAVNEKLGGMEIAWYARQIIMVIEQKLFDPKDESGLKQLRHLHEVLEKFLVV